MHRSCAQVWTYITYLQCCCLRNYDVFSSSDMVSVSLNRARTEGVPWRSTKMPWVCSESVKEVPWSHQLAENHTTALSQHLHCWQLLQTSYFLWSVKRGRTIGFPRTPITPGWHLNLASKGPAHEHEETLSDLSFRHWSSPQGMARGMKRAPQVLYVINRWREEKILWNLKDLNSNVLAEASLYLSNALGVQLSKVQKGMKRPWITFAQDNACTPRAQKAI